MYFNKDKKKTKLHCNRCFYNFTTDENKSFFKGNKTVCPICHNWIDENDKITKEKKQIVIEKKGLPLPKYPKREAKFIPSSILSENKRDDIVHYCKPDYYKYEMKKCIIL